MSRDRPCRQEVPMVAWRAHPVRSKLCTSGTAWSSMGLRCIALISGSSTALLLRPCGRMGDWRMDFYAVLDEIRTSCSAGGASPTEP